MNGPSDGWAYTPIELSAIWEMKVDTAAVESYRITRAKFFQSIGDIDTAIVLATAALADVEDPDPLAETPLRAAVTDALRFCTECGHENVDHRWSYSSNAYHCVPCGGNNSLPCK